jgi:peptidoglycan hydrolase-like protein with peptidoglycan-binding domain
MAHVTVDMRTLDLRDAGAAPVTGRHVRNLQGLLNVWLRSFDEEPFPLLDLDGVAGKDTSAMTVRFQEAQELTADAVVGPRTWSSLIAQSTEP